MHLTTEQSSKVSRQLLPYATIIFAFGLLLSFSTIVSAGPCPTPLSLGDSPTRLVVVVPGTGQGAKHWDSFLSELKEEPQSKDLAWLVFDHGVTFTSLGNARNVSAALESCIDEKVKANGYKSVTLIGHSIGGMLVRRAYLLAAGAVAGQLPSSDSWASKVDRILLFASVNRGIKPDVTWWSVPVNWFLHIVPHPNFVLEDFLLGSGFIADIRIAWIRHFGALYQRMKELPEAFPPKVVQFWGTSDSIVTKNDNADIRAFSGLVIENVSGAKHGDLNRLERDYTQDPQARWELFRRHLFDERPSIVLPLYKHRRVLFIVRGIRDSSFSEWVRDLRELALPIYEASNVRVIDYGYFSAAEFAFRPTRAKNIPEFRDLYSEYLAENPLTEFDFIGHSNATYIFAHSLLSTPSMQFRNAALAAPVLPTDLDWLKLFNNGQIEKIRYDTALWDWPVGILCQSLRALGFFDVGPAGVVTFGQGTMVDSSIIKKVGWYNGGHGAALRPENRVHLLNFVDKGIDLSAGETLDTTVGAMGNISRATPYVVWLVLTSAIVWLFRRYYIKRGLNRQEIFIIIAGISSLYVILDVI